MPMVIFYTKHSSLFFAYTTNDSDQERRNSNINPYLTNVFSHLYQFFRCVRNDFSFLSHFSMKFLQAIANRIAPDGTPRSAASHLGLFCLPMSHKRDARVK